MSLVVEVLRELRGMFIADARLAISTLALVSIVAVLKSVLHLQPHLAGAILLFGCLAIVVEASIRQARQGGAS